MKNTRQYELAVEVLNCDMTRIEERIDDELDPHVGYLLVLVDSRAIGGEYPTVIASNVTPETAVNLMSGLTKQIPKAMEGIK